MQNIKNYDLISIKGGVNISGSLLTSAARLINSLFELGRSFGTGIRRIISGKICPL